jgi:DNA repair protein RadC
LSGCQVPVREVFGFLLDFDAHRGIVAHNHPGGIAVPSPEDLHLTGKLVGMGRDLGVPIVDHLIVTRRAYISLSAMGEMG